MGKRSSFGRRPQDAYATPYEAIVPLLPHLRPRTIFAEPCCGEMALVRHLEKHGHHCSYASDISLGNDALNFLAPDCEEIITNPPWTREILHPLIMLFSAQRPTWLLFDADWKHTKQASSYMRYCRRIVSVGRIKWIPDSKFTGKDNAAWYLFTSAEGPQAQFYERVA